METTNKKPPLLRRPFKYTYFNATIILIIINCLVFTVSYLFPRVYTYVRMYGALNYLVIDKYHFYWEFFTYMFIHSGVSHLLFNMLSLLVFGITVEKTIGSKEFILFYMLCGAIAGLFSYFVYKLTGQFNVFLMGASGAIYSLIFCYAVLYPRNTLYVWGVVPVPSPLLVIIFTVIEIFSNFSGRDGVAHLTHLFGFVAAGLYFIIRMGIHPIKVWKDAYGK